MNCPGSVRNVIVVVIDALRSDRVGALDGGNLTPNLDKLADSGTIFKNAFTCINATDPSVTSIHTGRYPRSVVLHHGHLVSDEEKQRAESVPSLPGMLSDKGFDTVATGRPMGRWHRSGFDSYPSETQNGADSLDLLFDRTPSVISKVLERVVQKLAGAGRFTSRRAQMEPEEKAVEELLDGIGKQPFYGFIHLMDTHIPCTPREELIDEMLATYDYPNQSLDEFFSAHESRPAIIDLLRKLATDADYEVGLARLFARYDAAVKEADEKVGRLIFGLENRGLRDQTAIIALSDHGESLNEHGIFFDHHGLYDPSIHIPLIIDIPSRTVDRVTKFVQPIDLAPTITNLLDLSVDTHFDGQSLTPLLSDNNEEWDNRSGVLVEEAYAQRRVAIRTEKWKYIKHVSDPHLEELRGSSMKCKCCNMFHAESEELYDLVDDRGELKNLIGDRLMVAERLDQQLKTIVDDISSSEATGEYVEYEDEQALLERLAELGYR